MAIQADIQSSVQVEEVFKSSKVDIDQWTLRGRKERGARKVLQVRYSKVHNLQHLTITRCVVCSVESRALQQHTIVFRSVRLQPYTTLQATCSIHTCTCSQHSTVTIILPPTNTHVQVHTLATRMAILPSFPPTGNRTHQLSPSLSTHCCIAIP